jgi:fluoroacetyl-CoA thioesterase
MTVTVKGRLDAIDGRKLSFSLEAYDDRDLISSGSHDRFIIDAEKFNASIEKKRASIVSS